MTRFVVRRNYRAVYRSNPIGFDEGSVVEVDDETAEWVNNDSPGCLAPDTVAPDTVAPADDAPSRSGKARKPAVDQD